MNSSNNGTAIVVVLLIVFCLYLFGRWLLRPRRSKIQGTAGGRSITSVATNESGTRAERLAAVDVFHANELNAVEVRVGDLGLPNRSMSEAAVVMNEKVTGKSRNDPGYQSGNYKVDGVVGIFEGISHGARHSSAVGGLGNAVIRRTLRDLSDPERGIVRLADMLVVTRQITQAQAREIVVPIVWNNGSCLMDSPGHESAAKRTGLKEGLTMLLGGHFGDVATSSELVQTALRKSLSPGSSLAEEDRHVLEAYLFAGSRWLTPADAHLPNPSSSALMLGTFEGTQQEFLYDRRESLITIAPPGAGKSQAHVLRNLLHLRAPAIVLDIKGEAFRHTARWRRENVGPLFAFAPTMPGVSMHYNPLDAVSDDRTTAWDDARRLADLLVVPGQKGDPYFETRARDLLTVAILDVALNEPQEHRTMHSVLDRLYLNEEQLTDWLSHLEETKIPQLTRQAAAWRIMPEKQREGVFDSARTQVEIWQSPALEKLIDRTDWTPEDIREGNGTLYLCINLEDVKKFASVLRVIVGQTVAGLCRGEAEADGPIVTVFLDELPRLGRMDVIEEALDVGRGYGVRLWLFCQNTGQLRTAYPNAEGMIGNCAARCYMDPDDETAEELSRYLGQRKGLLDGRQKPLAEPTELKGTAFADKIVVFLRGKSPAKLMRRFPVAQAARAAPLQSVR